MANLSNSLSAAIQINGAIAVAVVDMESGMSLGQAGGSAINLEVAAAGNTEVVRAMIQTMQELNLNDEVEDILITLGSQYHLIRPIKTKGSAGLFLYLVLDKGRSNLAMARHKLAEIEKTFTL